MDCNGLGLLQRLSKNHTFPNSTLKFEDQTQGLNSKHKFKEEGDFAALRRHLPTTWREQAEDWALRLEPPPEPEPGLGLR